jgi:hypothetical protein
VVTHSQGRTAMVRRQGLGNACRESWGMAGMENDAYLVSNPGDNFTQDGGASEWLRPVGSTCEIVASKRMRRGIHIVTTYNCPLQ